jgi:arylsulfatase A-like enzyme
VPGLGHENDWGSLDLAEADYDDARTVDYAIDFLRSEHESPFFLACGTFRPHLPWYVPKKYFELYPLDEIKLPTVREDDLDDIPAEGQALSQSRRSDFDTIKAAHHWKQAVQAYLASISFADAQVGRLIAALDASGLADRTIVVLWSDHGWHLGEKNHWHKMTLWEEATRVPLIVVAPGVTTPGSRCASPASLIDVFPTLNELCGLPALDDLDGESLVPLLRDPNARRSEPVVIQYKRGQCAVRSVDHRYIRYSDGSEELYDHRSDPNEWVNLADDPAEQQVKSKLAKSATEVWAEPAPSKKAYEFDPQTYTWRKK